MAQVTTTVTYDPDEYEFFVLEKDQAASVHVLLAQGKAPAMAASVSALFEETAEVEGNGLWTRAMVERLSEALASPVVRVALDTIAADAPDVVPYSKILEATGADRHVLRAELGSLTRLTDRLFNRPVWPMTKRQRMHGLPGMGYRMPRTVAAWWSAASSNASPVVVPASSTSA